MSLMLSQVRTICHTLGIFGYFFRWFAHLCFGLGRGQISPLGPAKLAIAPVDRKDLNLKNKLSIVADTAGHNIPIRLKRSRWIGMGRVWDASKYPSETLATLGHVNVIQRHEGKKSSNWKFRVRWCEFFFTSVVFVRMQKLPQNTFWTAEIE